MIPPFDANGNLPPGIHQATWAEFVGVFGTNSRRERLIKGLYLALKGLKAAGCRTVYIDGSFVTTKDQPGDFDACWDPAGVDPTQLDPALLDFTSKRIAQKIKFEGEFFLSTSRAEASPPYRTFLEFFQRDKTTDDPKGIIALDLRRLP